jgi:hypothetical protein
MGHGHTELMIVHGVGFLDLRGICLFENFIEYFCIFIERKIFKRLRETLENEVID